MGIRRKVDMAGATAAETVPDELRLMSAPSRIRTAYFAARGRQGAPVGHLDWTFQKYNHDLAACRNANDLTGPQQMERATRIAFLLTETEATFIRWKDMPLDELSRETARLSSGGAFATSVPSPEAQVKMALSQAEAAGVKFELLQGSFRAYPAVKLEQKHRGVLTAHRALVVAELERRLDAWSPEAA